MTTFRRAATTAALALTLLVAGCATPPGTDGDLTNEWPALAEPQGWKPETGCQDYTGTSLILSRTRYQPVDCTTDHIYEIFHVGEVTGAEADLANPPDAASITFRKAWAECDTKASAFLGGQWRERRVRFAVAFPAYEPWKAGSKWFVCSMNRVRDLGYDDVPATTSLKDAFAEPSLQHGCHHVPEEGSALRRSCTEPHNAEFVGLIEWSVELSVRDKEWKSNSDRFHASCRSLIYKFVGATVSTGTWLRWPNDEDWEAGDRSLRCYTYTEDKNVSRSMKNVGAKGWLK